MKRKFLMIFCAAALSAGLLAGCGGEPKDDTKTENNSQAQDEQSGQDEQGSDETNVSTAVDDEQAKEAVDEKEAEDLGFSDGTDVEEENAAEGEQNGASKDEAKSGAEEAKLDTSELLKGIHHAELTIKDYGTIKMELDADTAPVTVTNFVKLIQDDFYDGLTFHRIIDGFMVQGGDPLGNGKGGADDKIKGEFENNGVKNDISHTRGTLSMARSSDPDSASSQFFIMQSDGTYLDGDYAAFGHVTEGMEIVDAICKDAEPVDNNGGIKKTEQPVIESFIVTD
ncbi:peptidylprolyl isomerase [Blautia schinkii]|nr:peptidylprolyl isomerase [Blautia schinkii]